MTKGSGASKKRRAYLREKLIQIQENLCFFCYCQMAPTIADHPTSARLFHLDDKMAPWRGKFPHQTRSVVCCNECAQEISDKRAANVPLEELHRRSGHTAGTVMEYRIADPQAST